MNKILLINYYYPPIVNGGVQRTYNFKKYLDQMGFEVSFLTTNSYGCIEGDNINNVFRFPDWGFDFTHSNKTSKMGKQLFRAFRLFQVKSGMITDGKYYWKKEVLNKLEDIIRPTKYDVVIASYPTPANLELGEYINKKYGIPLVVDYRDGLMFEPFYEVQHSFIVYRMRLKALEKRLAKIAALHLTVNKEMNEYYTQTYPNVKSVMIPNGFDSEEEINAEPIKLPEGINVLYTGSIGKSRKLYSFEELQNVLDNIFSSFPNINFVFVGDYEEQEKRLFNKYKNVYVFEKTEREKVIATQRLADALMLISGPSGSTSGKLYEYLFARKPIINLGGHKGIADIINGEQYGETCAPEEREKMKGFFIGLKNGSLHYSSGNLEQYTRKYQSELLAKELNYIIEKNQRK